MTYKELYEKAASMLDRGEITLGDFNKMVKPLDVEIHHEPHWIPVTERLPEKHGAYIVCYSDFRHGIYYGRVIAVAWFDLGDTWLKYRYADNARTFPPKLHYVIAWMPLPEPYKGVTT